MTLLADQPWALVLYTTRLAPDEYTKAGAIISPLDLDRLPENQAVDLIRRYQPGQAFHSTEHEAAAREIVRELSGLTLAVETAAVYLGQCDRRVLPEEQNQHAVDARDYLTKLREDLKTGGSEGVMSQLREVTATLRPTLARLDAPMRTVLQIASLLAPDGVALPWVRAIAGQSHPELAADAATGESDSWTQLIRGLIGMRLFQPTAEPRVVATHRILQQVIKTELSGAREQLEARLRKHVEARETALEETTHWVNVRWELEPLGALATLWADTNHPDAAGLLGRACIFWQTLSEWTLAEPLARRAVEIYEKRPGMEYPYLAAAFNNLAFILKTTNRWTEAEPLLLRALTILEKKLGKVHPTVGCALNNLAQLLKATNRWAEAEPLLRRVLSIHVQCSGPVHTNTAITLTNLAGVLKGTNRLAEAEPLYRRALAIFEQNLGKEHSLVAAALNNLAELLRDTNRLSKAEPLSQRALAISERTLGPEHPDFAIRLTILAALLRATNRLAEAEPLYRRALAIFEQNLSRDHSLVAAALNNLAELLRVTNRLAEAEPLSRRALAISEQTLVTEHPEVAKDLINRALLLQSTNRLAEAEPLMRRALAIWEQSLGAVHPEVATTLHNLAWLLKEMNRLAGAEPLMRRGVAILLRFTVTVGHQDPRLQVAIENYARLLEQMGRSPQEVLAQLNSVGQPFKIQFGPNT